MDARFGSYVVRTDQPPQDGGEGSAPTPFSLFLASIGTCAGIYSLGFCRQRGLKTEGLRIVPGEGHGGNSRLKIELPHDFPEKYKSAIIHAVELCAVKKHLQQPPRFEIVTTQTVAA